MIRTRVEQMILEPDPSFVEPGADDQILRGFEAWGFRHVETINSVVTREKAAP